MWPWRAQSVTPQLEQQILECLLRSIPAACSGCYKWGCGAEWETLRPDIFTGLLVWWVRKDEKKQSDCVAGAHTQLHLPPWTLSVCSLSGSAQAPLQILTHWILIFSWSRHYYYYPLTHVTHEETEALS
jgi:hypothetical protein